MAGIVLGVESVPDGLALGVLAGVNPLAGLYGYLYGTIGGAMFSSTTLLTVQVTGATAIIVADANLGSRPDPARALFTLAIITGVIMVLAGLLRAGALLRFVPRAVMVGFISGVGVNTILGQLGNFTGYDARGANRILRTFDLMLNFWKIDVPTLLVGVVTLVLIVVLMRTRLGALGLVVAVIAGSVMALGFEWRNREIAMVGDVSSLTNSLPWPTLPILSDVPYLIVPAVAIAFVALVQGAGVCAAFPNPDGSRANPSRDFAAQGAGSILSGIFQGMPASGSMSATALTAQAGAQTRAALLIAGGVMAVIVVVFADAVGYVAFPALAGLLMVIGYGTIKPAEITSVVKTGQVQASVLVTTFTLTMLMPVQFAVLVGVGLAVILFVVEQSNRIIVKQLLLDDEGHRMETTPPETVAPGKVLILQPYGSLFFASASALESQLPKVSLTTKHAVVIIRLRGVDDLGVSITNVMVRYAAALAAADSRLILNGGEVLLNQLTKNGRLTLIGPGNYYLGDAWHGRTLARANRDALEWIAERTARTGDA